MRIEKVRWGVRVFCFSYVRRVDADLHPVSMKTRVDEAVEMLDPGQK